MTENSNGSFCIRWNANNNVYLSFDTTQCTSPSNWRCGLVTAIYSTANSCSGREAFRFIRNSDGTYGIPNDCQTVDYLRFDGSSISAFNSAWGGNVNGQYYFSGSTTEAMKALISLLY